MIHFEIPENPSSIIKLIGVGGGGGNAINHMFKQNHVDVDFIICNTDSQALSHSPVANKIQLGPYLTQGLGAGANPEVGEKAAEESLEELKRILEVNTKMVFITAGMGGGTGTGGAPIIAKLCKELGILTVAIVTTPFFFEGKKRMKQALEGIEKLKENVDTIVIISNDKLREQCGNMSFVEAFSKADDILTTAASCITSVIQTTGQINTDFADVNTVMRSGGVAILGSSKANGEDRAIKATEEALNSPLLNNQNIVGAKWILLNINSSSSHAHTMDELSIIQGYVQDQAGDDCEVILGMGIDEMLEENISVTIIATGFEQKAIEDKMSAIKAQKSQESKIILELKENEIEPEATVKTYGFIHSEPLPVEDEIELNDKIVIHLEDSSETNEDVDITFAPSMIDTTSQDISIFEKLENQFKEESGEVKMTFHEANTEEDSPNEELFRQYNIPKVIGVYTLTEDERMDRYKFEKQKEHLEQRASGILTFNNEIVQNNNHINKYMEDVPAIERQSMENPAPAELPSASSDDFLSGFRITREDINNNKFISSINTFIYGKKVD